MGGTVPRTLHSMGGTIICSPPAAQTVFHSGCWCIPPL